MDPDTYKKRLTEIRISRISLNYLIERLPMTLVRELGEQGVEIERAPVNQMMKEFDRKVSNLIFNFEKKERQIIKYFIMKLSL